MDKLFLFEVVVEKIEFLESYLNHSKAEVIITAIFGNVLRLEIELDKSNETYQTLYAGVTKFNCGKSYLFSCDPEALKDAFDIYPLELVVSIFGEPVPIGVATIPWSSEFNTLLTLARTEDSVNPVYVRSSAELRNANKTKSTGTINFLIRLSYFGTNIQTSFEIKSERTGKKYLFKNVGGETKYQMQKCGSAPSAEMIPVGSIFDDTDFRHSILGSFDPVFIQNSSPPQSFYNVPAPQSKGAVVQVASDILSLVVRPDEKEFFNVFDIGKVTSDPASVSATEINMKPNDLTVAEIRKHLCNDPDCPGVQKFIELGIHPLAKNKNLGAVMGPTDIPLDYGLSQTYGVMERYGPYGYYSKPKSLDEPLAQKKFCDKCKSSPLRLNGGCSPLRLRGGGVSEEEEEIEEFPQPMAACKGLMDDFDKLLAEYKKAMGPCGKATCPFSGTIVQEKCKKLCTHSMENVIQEEKQPVKEEGAISACGTDECPHSRQPFTKVEEQFKLKQLKPACGTANCPYTKQKIEMALDRDAYSKTCGSSKYPGLTSSLPPLEPVHWECPDPLPKGLCKNPDCPYLPRELKVFKPRKGPCGGISCPYAPPPWCGSPVCPFGPPRPCPFAPPSPPPKEDVKTCALPDCPFMNQWPGKCDNPQCPYKQVTEKMYAGNDVCSGQKRKSQPQESGEVCGNPECPYAQPQQNNEICGNPECPYALKPQQNATTCGSPQCPYATNRQKPKDDDFCGNPECPHATRTPSGVCPFVENKSSVCDNPSCPHKVSNENELCENPECPYSPKKDIVCDNPFCPFAKKPSDDDYCGDPKCPNKPKGEGDDSCPFAAKMSDICDNPDCPFSPKRTNSPCFVPGSSGESCNDPTVCPYPPCYHPCMYPYPPPCAFKPPITCGIPDCPYDKLTPYPPCMAPIKAPHDGCASTSSSISTASRKDDTPQGNNPETDGSPTVIKVCKRCSSDDPCIPTTCAAGGGPYECEECMEGGGSKSAPALGAKAKKSVNRKTKSDRKLKSGGKKKRKKGKYVYSIGDKYPGVHVGHRECCLPGYRVPPKMGWLWNIPCSFMKPRRGWRPGAIGRTIAKRIYEFRKAKGINVLTALTTQSTRRRKGYQSESDIIVSPKPTLQIKKKDGAYFITMNPLKDPKTLVENENPYMDCTPLQFKIVKNKDKDKVRRGDDGDNEMKSCYCEEYDWPASTESSDSELDIEFTPPAGIIRPERFKRKKNVVHIETQCNPDEFKPDKLKLGGKSKEDVKGKGKAKAKGKEKGKDKDKDKGKDKKDAEKEKGKKEAKGGKTEKKKK